MCTVDGLTFSTEEALHKHLHSCHIDMGRRISLRVMIDMDCRLSWFNIPQSAHIGVRALPVLIILNFFYGLAYLASRLPSC